MNGIEQEMALAHRAHDIFQPSQNNSFEHVRLSIKENIYIWQHRSDPQVKAASEPPPHYYLGSIRF